MAWAIGLGIVGGIFGAASSASSQNEARSAQQKAIDAQYKRDKQLYNFNWEQSQREYQYRLLETNIARQNQAQQLGYQYQSAQRDYKYNLAIREFDFANQMRQYNESERIFGLQSQFNNQAAQLAHQAETARMQEIVTGMAFEQQDMLVKMLEQEGQIQARGVSGRSADKLLSSALAGYGRNQAILAESLLSANKDSKRQRLEIENQKYGADLAAHSRRMLKPVKAPTPPAPLKPPMPTFLDPLAPVKPPKPIKGANTVPAASGLSIANSFVTSGLSMAAPFIN
jgi:hypothetical protein